VPAPAAPLPACREAQPAPMDIGFEARMRGPGRYARPPAAVHRGLRDAAPVLDVGCGRGSSLPPEAGVGLRRRATPAWSLSALERAEVEQGDAIAHSKGSPTAARGRSPPGRRAPPACSSAGEPCAKPVGRVCVAETMNPLSLFASEELLLISRTHSPGLDLVLLARQAGFGSRSAVPARASGAERATSRPAPDGRSTAGSLAATSRLNEVVFGPQDFARRPEGAA
jgi:hypothetical protein